MGKRAGLQLTSYSQKSLLQHQQKENHEANETCTSFPAMLSPMSGPEESPWKALQIVVSGCPVSMLLCRGSLVRCGATGGNDVPLKVTGCLERRERGRRRRWKPMEEQGQPRMRVRSLAWESGLCHHLWNPGQLPALLELRYGLQILLRAHLSPEG